MSKTIRQKIARAIQTSFRSSSTKSKITSCCSVKKPNDYEFISYQPKQAITKNDYIDLSECHSWSLSYTKDSGISSINSSNQLQSTRIFSDDSSSLSTLSDISSIPRDQMDNSHLDVNTTWHPVPTSFECCHCHCHHYVKNMVGYGETNNYLYAPGQQQTKNKVYPFIF